MDYAESLRKVLDATAEFAGCEGVGGDKKHIDEFRKSGDPDMVAGRWVTGIPFAHFFADNEMQFESVKDSLWQAICEEANIAVGSLVAPGAWCVKSRLGQVASYVEDNT